MRKPIKPDSREATRRDAIMAEWLRRVAQSPGLTLISFKAACDRGEVPGLHTRDFVEPIATPAEVVSEMRGETVGVS